MIASSTIFIKFTPLIPSEVQVISLRGEKLLDHFYSSELCCVFYCHQLIRTMVVTE